MLELNFKAMGSQIVVLLDSDEPAAREELELVPIWFENWEQILSRFRENSELSRVNRSDGQWMRVSDTFWKVLETARGIHLQSGGLVSPLLLRELEGIGYTGSFDEMQKNVSVDEFWPPSIGRGSRNWDIGMEVEGRLVQLPGEDRLDFGGVAKGWAAQECMKRLAHLGPVLVNAGGDIAISEAPWHAEQWRIGVESPFAKGEEMLTLEVRSGGLATSGTDRRRWQKDGELQHHIIDPRSGRAADSDVLSCSVIAPNVILAEMAAKIVLILGSEEGLNWLNEQEFMSGVVILEDASLRYAEGFDIFRVREAVAV